MNAEREIVKRLLESKELDDTEMEVDELEESKLNEALPPILNKLAPSTKNAVTATLTKMGIDIQNTPYKMVPISSGRDPRLKGNNVVVIEIGTTRRSPQILVWAGGKFIADGYDYNSNQNFSRMSWKAILDLAKNTWVMEFDQNTANALKAKQAGRAQSKQGMVQRYTPQTKPRHANIDKSGYIVEPNKYKDMFAKLNISNGVQLLQQAKDTYVKLANNIDNIDFDNDRDFNNYEHLVRSFPTIFKYLKSSLNVYEKAKKESPKDPEFSKSWVNFREQEVLNNIKQLKDLLNNAKKYL